MSNAPRVGRMIRIQGVPAYFTDFDLGSSTWNDSSLDIFHNMELPVIPKLIDCELSRGALDPASFSVGASTIAFSIVDDPIITKAFARGAQRYRVEMADNTGDILRPPHGHQIQPGDFLYAYGVSYYVDNIDVGGALEGFWDRVNGGITIDPIHFNEENVFFASTATEFQKGLKVALTFWHHDGKQWVVDDERMATTWLDSTPRYTGAVWECSSTDRSGTLDRQFAFGLVERKITEITLIIAATTVYVVKVGDDVTEDTWPLMRSASNGRVCFAIEAEVQGRKYCFPAAQTAVRTLYSLAPESPDLYGSGLTFVELVRLEQQSAADGQLGAAYTTVTALKTEWTLRPVYPTLRGAGVDANPATTALQVMLSGVGYTAPYNVLPAINDDDTGKYLARVGCAIPESEVDIAAWEDAAKYAQPSFGYCVGAQQGVTLFDFLTQDVAPILGGYVVVDRYGRISFRRYRKFARYEVPAYTITDSNSLSLDNIVYDESTIVNSVRIPSHYDYAFSDFGVIHVAHYIPLYTQLDETAKTLESKSKYFALNFQDALTAFDAYLTRWGEGVIRVSCTVPWDARHVIPGDIVHYANPRVPNMIGGYGVDMICEVISSRLDLEKGTVQLDLAETPTARRVAPSFILRKAGSIWYADFDEGTTDHPAGANQWGTGWRVYIIDQSDGSLRTGGYSGGHYATITGWSPLTFSDLPTDAAAGDLVMLCGLSRQNPAATESAAFGAGPDGYLHGTTGAEWPPRVWG